MATPLLMACLALGLAALPARADDDIRFGDPASEAAHAFAGTECPAETGALGETCRRIGAGGGLVFTLACDPNAQNYLSVKLWGSDRDVATLFLFDGERRIGDYLSEWPELDLCKGEPGFPGRFYLVTYPIPREVTAGKERVTLRIAAVGSINPYANDPKAREQAQRGLTRGVYRAWSHTDPFLALSADETPGRAPEAKTRALPSGFSPAAELRRQADDAVDALRRWQVYGPEWDAAIARGEVPAVVRGAAIRPMRLEKREPAAWKDAISLRTNDGNSVALNVLAIYALAYADPASRWHGNPELLDRAVRGLDFYCRAQGANGAFNARAGWVGGPEREKAGSCLEGFGTSGLGQAFVVLADELAKRRLLDEPVDEDDDPATPAVSRRRAYAAMFERHRDFLASDLGRGHATNQDLAQMIALWLANESLRCLAPERAWPREKALSYARAAVGLAKDPLGGFWVTRKGLALEPWGTLGGGYCGNYGLMGVGQVCRLAELTGDPEVQRRALDTVHAAARFVHPAVDGDGFLCVQKEEVISTRNNNWPGRVDYGGDLWAAAVRQDPTALRALQLGLAQGHPRGVIPENNAHFVANVLDTLLNLGHYEQALKLPATAYRLPMEEGQPDLAWADEQAGTVVVKDRGARLYVSLNWRRGFKPGGRDPEHVRVNDRARIHYTTPTLDRVATVAMESPHGFGKLYLCRYGPYFIAMNLSEDATYEVAAPAGWEKATDLISRAPVAPGRPLRLAAASTVVLRQ